MQDYIDKKLGRDFTFRMKGELTIKCNDRIVLSQHNLIVDEGKGTVMDLLASIGVNFDYTPLPFNAIVLTKNNTSERASDTFKESVYKSTLNQISNEGVLHVGGSGGGQVAITHVKGALTMTVSGTLSQAFGNDSANNHINSVCLCSGTNQLYGGPGQAAYAATGNERIFARVHCGDLVKTVDKSFSFSWLITIQ